MEITIDNLCEGITEVLKKEGHKMPFYSIEGDKASIVSGSAELYEIARKEEESRTLFEVTCKQGKISDGVYDYIDKLKSDFSSFPSGMQKVIVGVNKEG